MHRTLRDRTSAQCDRGNRLFETGSFFGSSAVSERPVALRPNLAIGLPLSGNLFRVPRGVSLNLVNRCPRAGSIVYDAFNLKDVIDPLRVKLVAGNCPANLPLVGY